MGSVFHHNSRDCLEMWLRKVQFGAVIPTGALKEFIPYETLERGTERGGF